MPTPENRRSAERRADVESDFDRGREAGRIDGILTSHGARLDAINGSVGKTALNLSELSHEMRESRQELRDEVRGLREDARLSEQRVIAAAEAIEKDREGRASKLADETSTDDRRFTKWQQTVGIALVFASLIVTVLIALGSIG